MAEEEPDDEAEYFNSLSNEAKNTLRQHVLDYVAPDLKPK